MGRLSFKNAADVSLQDPCTGFRQVQVLNNVPPEFQANVLQCTYLEGVNYFQIVWLIVFMEPQYALEIAEDIWEANNEDRKSITEIKTQDIGPIFTTDSGQEQSNKIIYYLLKSLSEKYPYPRTPENGKALVEDIVKVVKNLAIILNKDELTILRKGLIRFESKIIE